MLFGRRQELDVLGHMLDAAGSGWRTVIVEGEAGIGKTELLAELVRTARAREFQVFFGGAGQTELDRPFAAIARTVRNAEPPVPQASRTVAMAEGRPGQSRWVDPLVDNGFRIMDAVAELIADRAAAGPVLLVLDDLHWADRPSTEILGTIYRRLTDRPIVLAVALRTGEGSAHCHTLLEQLAVGGALQLGLTPLADEAVSLLAKEITGATPGPRLAGQLTMVGGNPFFASELLRMLAEEGRLTVDAEVAESTATALPRGLVHTMLRRLRLLPEDTLELLRFAAVLGQSFSVTDLASVTGRGAVELTRALTPALRSHTLRETGELLGFGHELTWEAVYHDMPAAVRRVVHRQSAALLMAAGVAPARVARHLVLGAEIGDTQAVTWLRDAARDIAAGSPVTAAELLGHARTLAGDDHPDRDSIVAELAPLLVVVGRLDEAEELTVAALARGVDARFEAKLRVGLIHVLMRCGRVDDARAQASGLLTGLPAARRERALGMVSYVNAAAGATDVAQEQAERAVLVGQDVEVASALMTLTWTYAAHGRLDEAIAAGERAVRVTESSRGAFSGFLFPHCPLGAALLQADRFDEATHAFRAGLARAERTAAPGTLVYHRTGLVAAAFGRGDWDGALAEAELALEIATQTRTSWVLLPGAVTTRILVARNELGRAEVAIRDLARAPEASHQTMLSAWPHWARAVLLDAAGERDRAIAAAEWAWRAAPAMRDVIGNRVAPVDCTRIALVGGYRALAEEIAAELDRMARRTPVPSLVATAAHCNGLVHGDLEALTTAVELLRPSQRRYQLAMACEDAAAGWARADRTRSRTLFRDAVAGYRQLGAHRDVARVSAMMRAAGIRPGGTTRDHGTTLTRAERKVAELVAEGLSNPQIAQRLYISRHTAETHLKHIFAKLDISSRAQLAAAMARPEIPELREAGTAAGRAS